jgi:hypothetical protein
MKIEQIKLLYSLFFKASNMMLKISLAILPFVIAISFASILFINNLSYSYKNYLLQSYIGTQGVATIRSQNLQYLQQLKQLYNNKKITTSLKKEQRAKVIFETKDYQITKMVKFIILQKQYLKNKFHYTKEPIIINKVLANILNNPIKLTIKNQANTKMIYLNHLQVIDTGFLINEPLIFIDKQLFEQLQSKKIVYNLLEINTSLNNLSKIKKIAYNLSEKYSCDVDIYDILSKHKQTQLMFHNIKYIEYVMLFITILLASVILIGALSIISILKAKAISLLRVYGLSTSLIALSLTILSGVLLLVSLLFAFVLFWWAKVYFVSKLGLSQDFFIPLSNDIYISLGGVIVAFVLLIYFWGMGKFKGKIKL